MRTAKVYFNNQHVGFFLEIEKAKKYQFSYLDNYEGPGISLTMPSSKRIYEFDIFPPFFDGLLPEGPQLEALLKQAKLDRHDYFGQLMTVGHDMVGAVTVEETQ